ncbi:NAD+ synthase/NAD+ synthase (glutamine-hydrolysing) [Pseudidiomarina planktonica]|uniref:Glutamine-dependent NAD(+) synthetase n=1 Tax=Pseudidiomarina planktonica TaxID=1323738 RepID=A0A1Y6FZR4_9GAMM|nr:NAD+ synthase [Pseudidiomarina planktonica]RUO63222.1 NAD+ synthase [Pseudidiomarina planktonica]SMQ80568.1 NAD+ synthase/NAD+ synthase (glutamine-hydrolysing) [Pseudidiomarina planktonica]
MNEFRVCLAQLDFTVGAIQKNVDRMLATMAAHQNHDLIVFPELAVTGYPPEDLLFREDFEQAVDSALEQLAQAAEHSAIVVGHPHRVGDQIFNVVSVYFQGDCLVRYAKQRLPNYGVFDEQRYFIPANEAGVLEFRGQRIGLLICEDLWHPDPIKQLENRDIDWVLTVNASPFEVDKYQQRLAIMRQRAAESGLAIVYLNNCGGQDELVFDGHSLVMNKAGELIGELPVAQPLCATLTVRGQDFQLSDTAPADPGMVAKVHDVLVLAIRDYVQKNGFKGVLLGLSGGIDSALTLALATTALGADKVQAVMMPYTYTSSMSLEDAEQQATTLGVTYNVIPIEKLVSQFTAQLDPVFSELDIGSGADTTVENLQARCRGVLLMALSNKTGKLVLPTGNKSEMSVGYATLYGDMCGGFAPLKDLPKMLVYALANYCNREQEIIPQRVITRPPTAELAPDQTDEESLMPYAELDKVLSLYVEQDWSYAEIVAAGFDADAVKRILAMVDLNEYKRAQSAVGPKVTGRSLSRDRRYPITNHFRYQKIRNEL